MKTLRKNHFHDICIKCDEILFENISNIARVANPYLHVIRAHPFFLKQYKNLIDDDKKFKLDFFKNIIKTIFFLLSSILYKNTFFEQILKLNNKDVVVISHLVSKKNFDTKEDFYFGAFNEDIKSLFCLMNHTKIPTRNFLNRKNNNQFILENYLGVIKEFQILITLIKEYYALFKNGLKEQNKLKRKVYFNAANAAFSFESFNSIRIGFQVQQILKKVKPKVLLFTFEGYSWERSAIAYSKKLNQNIKCIGYVHSAVFDNQHAIFRNLNYSYNPDLLFSASENMKKQIKEKVVGADYKVYTLGSFKKDKIKSLKNTGSSCLVIPEGIVDECTLLFEFSLKCALMHPNITFIWRLHPVISFEKLVKKNNYFINLPKNIIISNNTFEEDILLSRVIIYRGSTAIIKAVRFGLTPIYFDSGDQFSIDPIYQFEKGKFIIKSSSEFIDVYNNAKINKKLIKYCDNFYDNFKKDLLLKFVNTKSN